MQVYENKVYIPGYHYELFKCYVDKVLQKSMKAGNN